MKPKHLFIPQGNNAWSVVDAWQSHAWLMGYNRQHGHDPCNWMRLDYVKLLRWVARSVYWETQESPGSQVLIVGDFSNHIKCEGHPGNSHSDGVTFDHNYFTFGKNLTQIRPPGMDNLPLEVMWKNLVFSKNPSWYDGELDVTVFNWRRNWIFWRKLLMVFGKGKTPTIMVHEKIREYVVSMLDGREKKLAEELVGYGAYNHHIHAHVQLADIKWEVEV